MGLELVVELVVGLELVVELVVGLELVVELVVGLELPSLPFQQSGRVQREHRIELCDHPHPCLES